MIWAEGLKGMSNFNWLQQLSSLPLHDGVPRTISEKWALPFNMAIIPTLTFSVDNDMYEFFDTLL